MCKRLTVAYGDFIGQRLVGWCVFNGKDCSFLSDKQIKTKLQQGVLVNGLRLDGDNLDNVVRDSEFTGLLMGKSGLTFEPIMTDDGADEDSVMNKYYALVKVAKGKVGTEYHFITNRCGYEVFSEQQLKAMLEVLAMGGIQIDTKGKLMIHTGIEVEQSTDGTSKPKEELKAWQNFVRARLKETRQELVAVTVSAKTVSTDSFTSLICVKNLATS